MFPRVQTSTATNAVAQSMDTAAKAMASVGKANNPAEMQRIMQQFQRENAKSEMAGEMMDDALDSAFDTDDMEGETDDIVDQACLLLHNNVYTLYTCPYLVLARLHRVLFLNNGLVKIVPPTGKCCRLALIFLPICRFWILLVSTWARNSKVRLKARLQQKQTLRKQLVKGLAQMTNF